MKILQDRVLKSRLVNWRQLSWLQGNLKEITTDAFEKLIKSILKNDFSDPFKIWKDSDNKTWILNGHHRFKALQEIEKRGLSKIPDLLTGVEIECKNKREAAKMVLLFNSKYANISEQGLYELTHEFEIDYKDIELEFDFPEIDFEHYKDNYFEEPEILGENQQGFLSETKETECPNCGHKF